MRLIELRIHRLPGVHPGFTLDGLAAGVNILTGPNASGKSSVMRAVKALFYESELRGQGVFVEGVFDDDGTRLESSRLGDAISWKSAGIPIPAPQLPDPRFLACYTLRLEDLGAPAKADEDISARIARELAGGYDVAAVKAGASFSPPPKLGQTEQKQLEAAREELRLAQRKSEALYAREGQLTELRERKADAEAAEREAEKLRAAHVLLGFRRRQQELGMQLESLPVGLDLLRGDELDLITRLHAAAKGFEAAIRDAMRRRKAAEAEFDSSGLSASSLSDADIREARVELQGLQRLEPLAERQAAEAAKADLALREARARLGSPFAGREEPDAATTRLDPDTLHLVENGLEQKRELEAHCRQLQSELDGLAPDGDQQAELETLRSARHELLGWLAAAGAHAWTGGRIAGLALLLLAFAAVTVAAIAGNGLAELVPVSENLALPLLGLTVLLGLYLFGWADYGRKRASRAAFERCPVPGPEAWRVAEVRTGLDRLGNAIAAAERAELERERRGKVGRQLEELQRRLAATREPLAELADRVGFDPSRLDASFERWLKLVADHDRSLRAGNDARAELGLLEGRIAEIRSRLHTFLAGPGETPNAPEPDSQILAVRLEQLERRVINRNEAIRAIADADSELDRLQTEMERNRQELSELYERAGLSLLDEPAAELELRRRLGVLKEWQDHSRKLRELAVEERSPLERLEGRNDLLQLVADDDERELTALLAAKEERARRRDEYSGQIIETETLIGEAEKERTLERKRAARQSAEDRLRSRYQETLFAAAGNLLLEGVENEHVTASRPETLRQAEEWFGLFTRHRYALRFEPASGFAAIETSSAETRTVHELSTGSKAQLLLAVRIAFALRAEQGRLTLPLFLDEALTTADPERFRAVADSLRILAETGRQIFYLTARADDARYWQGTSATPPTVIDIAKVRGASEAITEPELLSLPERRPPPAPGSASAEEYALELGVPPVDPWSASDAVHVFHLVRHDLELLHGLLEAGVDRLGILRSFLRSDAEIHRLSAGEQRELETRCRAADEWIKAWRVGRGQPLGRQALEESGAVTSTFLDRLDELARSVAGDAGQLIEALRIGRIKGFREDRRLQLHEWLADNGFLDERQVLSPDELRHRVVAALLRTEGEQQATVDSRLLELVRSVADCLEAGLRAGRRQVDL